jgi:small subunit ribosomal protein SAe
VFIPVIALCDTNSPLQYIDITIPTNNKSWHSVGLVWWLLVCKVLRLCSTIPDREAPWEFGRDVMVDMYFHCDAEEQEKDQQEETVKDQKAVTTATGEDEFATGGGEWDVDASAVTGFPVAAMAGAGDWDSAGCCRRLGVPLGEMSRGMLPLRQRARNKSCIFEWFS